MASAGHTDRGPYLAADRLSGAGDDIVLFRHVFFQEKILVLVSLPEGILFGNNNSLHQHEKARSRAIFRHPLQTAGLYPSDRIFDIADHKVGRKCFSCRSGVRLDVHPYNGPRDHRRHLFQAEVLVRRLPDGTAAGDDREHIQEITQAGI